jgi:hypothetical protein
MDVGASRGRAATSVDRPTSSAGALWLYQRPLAPGTSRAHLWVVSNDEALQLPAIERS